jgi:hypothetical protein
LRPAHVWHGRNGGDEESGKEVMGHESLTMTMGYLHPEAQIKVVIDRLNQQKHVM